MEVNVTQNILTVEQSVVLPSNPIIQLLEVAHGPVGPEGPPGPPGASAEFIAGETPSGLVDGINGTFQSVYDFVPESVNVFINGLAQRRVTDFNTSGVRTVILLDAPTTGESIRINYLRG